MAKSSPTSSSPEKSSPSPESTFATEGMSARVSVREPKGDAALTLTDDDYERVDLDAPTAREVIGMATFNFTPNSKQVEFAEYLLMTSKVSSHKAMARRLGVSEKTIYHWYQNPAFRLWVETVRKMLFMYYKPLLDKVLINKALTGSYRHLELAYTLMGDLQKTLSESETEVGQYERMDGTERYARLKEKITRITGVIHDRTPVGELPERIRMRDEQPAEEDSEGR